MPPADIDLIDRIMKEHNYDPSSVIAMLQDIQKNLRYLPQDGLRLVAERIGVPAGRVYSLATFYRTFSLKPRGRHLVRVCLGTACHVKGGSLIMDKILRDLKTDPGEMTRDEKFTVEPVRCVGCCGLAPVIVIDDDFFGEMTQLKTPRILGKYE
ncbi:MAG: NAD(P)H-dependent oxidoreductase subunit E [Fidelibacterota bacterium]